MPKFFPELCTELRERGFIREISIGRGAERCVTYTRTQMSDGRQIVVQLWADGNHRVSHNFRGCSDTQPTDFTDLAGMGTALNHERARRDSRYRTRR